MISTTNIARVLGERLAALVPAVPIVWPNKDAPSGASRPYLIFEHVPVSRIDDTLKGGGIIAKGFIMVTAISEIGVFSTRASDLVESVALLFPYALRIPVTNGAITIMKPPEVMQGYPDELHWRTPLKITYEAS